MKKDEIIILLDNGNYIHLQYSDEPAIDEDCDSCIDYTLFDEHRKEIDGGSMEYNSLKNNYGDIENAIDDVIDFAYDEYVAYTKTDLLFEDGFEA